MTGKGAFQFWIDRGGTFTDVVVLRPDGLLETEKLLSECPERYDDAAAEGIRRAIARWRDAGNAAAPVEAVKMGTTVATNALLERKGASTALAVTEGFADALAIGYQNRPDIFALQIRKPEPLYRRVMEVRERLDATGEVLIPLDEKDLASQFRALRDEGISSLAICLMHAYRNPRHERRVADVARACGLTRVSASHEVEALIKFVSRAETTLADAYLTPVLDAYISGLSRALQSIAEPRRLMFMQSSGGLVLSEHFRGKDSVLSGPAAGVVGMVETARAAGLERLIGFDMGGTSTDVSAWSGEYERSDDSELAGVRLRAPMMKIHTIAAGGGSILRYRDRRFQVGPESAGANPGPAAYRRGGPLTVSDAYLLLGRIPVAHFPAVFGEQADEPLDAALVRVRFEELAGEIAAECGMPVSAEDAAAGFLTVAVETMANAIRKITVERGEDARDFTLCCFGGAGGQHACRVAGVLGIRRIWIHPLAGVLSAYGMGLADIRVERQLSIEQELSAQSIDDLGRTVDELRSACDASLEVQNVPAEHRRYAVSAGLRVAGSDSILAVPLADAAIMAGAFAKTYRDRFGADAGDAALIIATLRVEAVGIEGEFRDPPLEILADAAPRSRERMWVDDGWQDVPVFLRRELGRQSIIGGPAIVAEDNATTVIDAGWRATVNEAGHLLMERCDAGVVAADSAAAAQPDPVRLEVFNRLFMHIAEQMGTVLQNTALSVNIRERLDFSCALFDARGRLVSNAPHMPVHLGSMGESVRSVIAHCGPALGPDDAVMLNSPYNGGTHLPDITVVTPWFADGDTPQFFLASRAHHADIGGITPGSMPSASRHIGEEGVLIDNFFLVRDGVFQGAALEALLGGGAWPARNPAQNVADLKAQLAANRQGIRQLEKAVARYGMDTVQRYLRFVRENAAASVRRLLGRLTDGTFTCELDSGEEIRVSIHIDRGGATATVDFSGTSPQSDSNFNAPQAVTRAAVLYV
ncbi:MAG: hydantoinase B/oxoprolinase family protein, partial [Woeseiaceae bacterium]